MKTTRVILTVTEDHEFGGLGLLAEGMRKGSDINPAQRGLVLAHDLLEHQNGLGDIGTIDDELEALGGIWFVRGQHGELTRDGSGSAYSVHENIASDITRMFRDFFYGAHVNLSAPRTMPCDADTDFEEILRHALKDAHGEVDDESPEVIAARLAEYIRVCLPRMRIGYRKAARRFNRNAFVANNLFWLIEEATDRHCRHPEYEGQQFELVFGRDKDGDLFARCHEHYPDDEED